MVLVWWKRQVIWWFAALVTVASYTAAIGAMFIPQYHAHLLRRLGYGGGLPVTIEFKDGGVRETVGPVYLVLRTTSAVIVFDDGRREIREFSLAHVRCIQHEARPLVTLKHALPVN